jgi:hypothetical protein
MTRLAALTRTLGLTVLGLLNACGGSSGGSGGSGGSTVPVSYHVGGAIAGLTTAGLALTNGSDSVSPAAGATAFTFGIPEMGGASYAVTVQTQPANATCTVSNGTGTVTGAPVTSVQVSCSLNTYQIGGAISGLTAAGLALANGSDTVNPTANATSFVFATPVTAGNTYNVTLTQQPSGQHCTLATASGTANANVSNVAVSCAPVAVAAWSSPTVLGTGVQPLLANDPSGVAFFLAWCTCADVTTPALATRYTDANGWTTPVIMAHGPLTGLQLDAQGKGFALWAAPTGTLTGSGAADGSVNAMYSRYIPGTGWASAAMPFAVMLPPVTTPPNSLVYSSFPPLGLSVGLDGTAVALVQENVSISSNNGNVSVSNMAALVGGAPSGTDVLQIGSPDALFPSSDSAPTSLLDVNGNAVPYFAQQTFWPSPPVVTPSTIPGHYATLYWTVDQDPQTMADGSPGLDRITTRALAMSPGSASTSTILLQKEDLLAENPLARGFYRLGATPASTAFAPNGDALTTWSIIAEDLNSFTVYAQRFVGGVWQARQVVYVSPQNPNYSLLSSGLNNVPVAALDGTGDGMIVIPELDSSGKRPLLNVKLNATTGVFSTATLFEPADSQPTSLQMDARGNAFLLESGAVRRYDAATGTWGAPFTFAGVEAVLALDNTGNAMVAWVASGSILASRYH